MTARIQEGMDSVGDCAQVVMQIGQPQEELLCAFVFAEFL